MTAWLQINLHLTDPLAHHRDDIALPHDCLLAAAWIANESDPYEIVPYCVDEWPPERTAEAPHRAKNVTFGELRQGNITSEQLYFWSAPIDVMERYELYLNLLSLGNVSSTLHSQTFLNCTPPMFGSSCQYTFDFDTSTYGSLNDLLVDYYRNAYQPSTLTCYMHLQCDRGASVLCLDWAEVCDGVVNCREGIDEALCWQLETNRCPDDEHQCCDGRCVSKSSKDGDGGCLGCMDMSARWPYKMEMFLRLDREPISAYEDATCRQYLTLKWAKLTGSCLVVRDNLVQDLMFSIRPANISDQCWSALKCQLAGVDTAYPQCFPSLSGPTWSEIINMTCPDLIDIPASVVTFGHLFFLYRKERLVEMRFRIMPAPDYVCYDDQRCAGFSAGASLLSFQNATCRRPADFPFNYNLGIGRGSWRQTYVLNTFRYLYRCNTIPSAESTHCSHAGMHQCRESSKCISKYHVCDHQRDCDDDDDEEVCVAVNGSCPASLSTTLFLCESNTACISSLLVGNDRCDCHPYNDIQCDDEPSLTALFFTRASFPTICDRYTELSPISIDGQSETDETECQYWSCNNTYTRCNRFWNCWDGADEVDCDPSPLIPCPVHHHVCVSPSTYQFICLPLRQAGDGRIDCLGATDEVSFCHDEEGTSLFGLLCTESNRSSCKYYAGACVTDPCDKEGDLIFYDDCDTLHVPDERCRTAYCNMAAIFNRRTPGVQKPRTVFFTLPGINHSDPSVSSEGRKTVHSPSPVVSLTSRQAQRQRCHRGLPILVWSYGKPSISSEACLCPPAFYGHSCQYQNQRVSLSLRFQTYSDSQRTLFAIVVMLIDDERLIHSHHQFSYIYALDCQNEFNVFLHYAHRPKNLSRRYAVRVDVFEKVGVVYRGSFHIPLRTPFLPVHRLALHLTIPHRADPPKRCAAGQCLHGRCRQFTNGLLENDTFCQCDEGWSGRACDIHQSCNCSSDSVCVGTSSNGRSLCVCPLGKWGAQCRLRNTRCESGQQNICLNGGQCIPTDEHVVTNRQVKCLCLEGYSGERCELDDVQLDLSFHQDIALPDAMFVHFIRVIDKGPPMGGSIVKRFSVFDRTIVVHWPHPFHIVFVELSKQSFYRIKVQTRYRPATTLARMITPSDRCPHLSELLNDTLVQYHLIRRIKYYHLACRSDVPALSCFYDANHFCLCHDYGHQRQANCFEYDPAKTFDCGGRSNCMNGAACVQDRAVCPQTSACICRECFHGTICQFSSRGLGLSLDGILGYYIRPHVKIGDQSTMVQISVAVTILMVFIGLINGSLSLITFSSKAIIGTSCGLLLLGSSVTTLLTMFVFASKFVILLVAQSHNMGHGWFLQAQCISVDFLLRMSLNTNQWLNACVAIERAVIAIKKTSIDGAARKRTAKYLIFAVVIVNAVTVMDDPIRRRLVNDESNDEEPRTWCVLAHSSSMQMVNTVVSLFHFSAPFLINLVSGAAIILITARQRLVVQPRLSHKQILHEQIQLHMHLLISPVILILLSMPRLIIYLLSSCMRPVDNAWLYLTGYLVSFLPSMLTFVVFVLPSKFYRDELAKQYKGWKRTARLRLANT